MGDVVAVSDPEQTTQRGASSPLAAKITSEPKKSWFGRLLQRVLGQEQALSAPLSQETNPAEAKLSSSYSEFTASEGPLGTEQADPVEVASVEEALNAEYSAQGPETEDEELWELPAELDLTVEPADNREERHEAEADDLLGIQPVAEAITITAAEDFAGGIWIKEFASLDLGISDDRPTTDGVGAAAISDWLRSVEEEDWFVSIDAMYDLLELVARDRADNEAQETLCRVLRSLGFRLDGGEPEENLQPPVVPYDFDDMVEAILCAIPEPGRHPGDVPKRSWGALDEDRAFADLRRAWTELFSTIASDPHALLSIANAAADHLEGIESPIRFSAIEIDWRRRPEEASRLAQTANSICEGLDLTGFRTDRASLLARIDSLHELDIETRFLRALADDSSRLGISPEVRERMADRLERIEDIEHRLLMMHAGHVLRIAERHSQRGLEVDDLFQIGFLGLMRSIRTFDPARGFRLQGYAASWIRQFIERAIAEQAHTVRLPVHRHFLMREVEQARSDLGTLHVREPSSEEIAGKLGAERSLVSMLLSVPRSPVGLEEIEDEADDDTTSDPFFSVQQGQLSFFLATLIEQLPERQAHILRRRYGLDGDEPMTLEELGEIEGVTRERIRQIEAKALDWLRHPARRRQLEQAS